MEADIIQMTITNHLQSFNFMFFELVKEGMSRIKFENSFIAELDGEKAMTVEEFLSEISKAFKFPDYFGNNYNALEECLNDLDWINEDNYILVITNYDYFLKNENEKTLLDTLSILNGVAFEWANVPNFDGEEQFRKKSEFKILIQWSDKAESDLKSLNFMSLN
jgi:RNAse (barnase) inhibitor barstar